LNKTKQKLHNISLRCALGTDINMTRRLS